MEGDRFLLVLAVLLGIVIPMAVVSIVLLF
jgi:hypothetical protein